MRILVIGAGVLGCNLAASLYKAGKDVTLLARGKWYEEINARGLRIKDKFRFGTKTYQIHVISELKAEDRYDAVFVSLRFTQLDSIYPVLTANVSENLIFNGNNTRTEAVTEALPGKNVMFSFSQSAGAREATRVNSINLRKITIGDVDGHDNRDLIRRLFEGAKYKVSYQPNMRDYLLCHAAFIVPAAFACYYTNGDLRKISRDQAYLEDVIKATIECYAALQKLGTEIIPESDRAFRTEKWKKQMLLFYKLMCATPLGKVCASDHAMNAADEMQALAISMRSYIDRAGTSAVYYEKLWEPLQRMNK